MCKCNRDPQVFEASSLFNSYSTLKRNNKKIACCKSSLPPVSRLRFTRITKGVLNEFCHSSVGPFPLSGETQRELAVGRRPALPLHRRLLPQHQVPGRQRRARASSGLVHPAQRAHPSCGRPPAGGSITLWWPPRRKTDLFLLLLFL